MEECVEDTIDSTSEQPLILVPGMGADASIFARQKLVFPQLIVPEWTTPEKHDDLASYAKRMAESLKPTQPCLIGGASFGGIVALEMARYLDAKACVLIGSVRHSPELPMRIRGFRPLGFGLKVLPIPLIQKVTAWGIPTTTAMKMNHLTGVLRQFSTADPTVLRWSAQQILKWEGCDVQTPVFQIHGDRDFVFPIRNLNPDEVVHGGGHVISATHGKQVNAFIARIMAEHA